MYVLLETEKVYVFRQLEDPKTFFRNLRLLLLESDCVVGVGCYDPDPRVKKWLESLPSPRHVPRQFDGRPSMAVYAPHASAYYFDATDEYLEAFAKLAAAVINPSLLCSHVVAFRGETALISFHDAFEGGAMLISSSVRQDRVRRFGEKVGLKFMLFNNPQWRPGRRVDGLSVEAALDLQELEEDSD
jgi:hypothetical protein